VKDPASLGAVLAAALGVRGVVRKRRRLYLIGRTRVHLDRVEGLGDFIELEVVLGEAEAVSRGEVVAAELADRLGIARSDLVRGAYLDLLVHPTE
jgi:predicted adenylyl cyclase CyaB